MNSKEAIDLLSIDGRTLVKLLPTQASEIAELIQQQDKMLELACVVLTENGIGCPASIDTIEWPECDDKCDVDDIQECTCWRKYLQDEVSK